VCSSICDGHLFDLGPSGAAVAPSLKAAITTGLLAGAGATVSGDGIAVDEAHFLPVIPDPAKIFCVGANFQDHREETGKKWEAVAPVIFTRFADTQIGHGQSALRPTSTEQFDYEGEPAVVIGAHGRHISRENAESVIAGYSIYNDFSARDWQLQASQWTPGKNFPATGAFGPYLVQKADIPDVSKLNLTTRVNGEVRQQASLGNFIFDIPSIIEYITGFTPITPGDVIVMGTPGGVGLFREPKEFLNVGDRVTVEIDELGTLENVVGSDQ
jgi:2-keto-4-pentenoate hydratase/2-oxohepta-3-ene-1,7-dioic acid hydratase in catechol pathway